MSAKQIIGTVTKVSSARTATVSVMRHVEHPILRKRLYRSTSYLIHDPDTRAQVDDLVRIIPHKVSARKNYALDCILRRRGKVYEETPSST
ncbi:hypothetical protein DL93DRAFT_2070070 [Clavulina sp. PMI_390]|nr:hypothetical protein DL93DRAFT_2070070 [Clavulina sp. PMI_390]